MDTAPAGSPRAGGARRAIRSWHRAFGLFAAFWLLLLGVTGSVIAFYDEIDRALNPDLWTIAGETPDTPAIGAALRHAGEALPGFAPRFIDLPGRADAALAILGSATGADGQPMPVQAFSDPRDGRLLGWRDERIALDRHHLMPTIYRLHTELLLHDTGVWLLGLLALLWMLDHVAGAVLAIPRIAGALSAWRIAGRGLNLRRLYDLHRAPSLWLLPLTLMLAVTGLCLTWYEETRGIARLVTTVSGRLHLDFPRGEAPEAPAVGPDEAMRIVRARVSGDIDSMLALPAQAVWGVRSFDPRDIDDLGRLWTYVSMVDGSIAGQRHDNGSSAGDTFFAWQYPLHSGRAFGTVGKWIICAAGLGTAGICLTGVWLWWRRRA